jgi:hypothetical protein
MASRSPDQVASPSPRGVRVSEGAGDGSGRATLGGLFAELKQRRVFRALVGYGIFAFAILQVIEPVLHGLHLPDSLLTAVVIGLAAGLPITVLVSWTYDLRGGSLVRAPEPARRSSWQLAGLVVAGALLGAGLAWGVLRHAQPEARKGCPASSSRHWSSRGRSAS